MSTRKHAAQEEPSETCAWSPRRKIVVTGLLVLHIAAAFTAPWSIPPPSSYLSQRLAGFFQPYLEAAYLYHGYRFFAPNPGPSHLVRYVIEKRDGSTVEGTFPDRNQHWPRLLYHRHFMLSETLFNRTQPFMDADEEEVAKLSPTEREEYEVTRAPIDALVKSVAKHLINEHDGVRVELYLVQHEIAGPLQIQEKVAMDDPQFFQERKLGEFRGAEL